METELLEEFNETLDYEDAYYDEYKTILPLYLRIVVGVLLIVIFLVGTVGNLMVMVVIISSRSMRSSTNFFLLNLSLADLLVLLFVTPTCLLEVIHHTPDVWLLGPIMCKLVPVLELLVSHASVLTILAISLERYYAICTPLKVLYMCTKSRALKICTAIWVVALIVTSPTFFSTYYEQLPGLDENGKAELQPMCIVSTGQRWQYIYQLSAILFLFMIPLIILLIIYRAIALKMRSDRSALSVKNEGEGAERSRAQIVYMLGAIVLAFFLCHLPFRLLAIAFLLTDFYSFLMKSAATREIYYGILYFCRLMIYVNSAVNPILYNAMSSKFRNGFRKLSFKLVVNKSSPQESIRRTGTTTV